MEKDLLTIRELKKEDILSLIERGLEIKTLGQRDSRSLAGYTIGLMFDKASTRTRVSFQVAMFRLGGQTLFLSRSDTQLSRDETVADTARVLSRYLDALVIRTFSQDTLEEMSRYSDIPVINALTDLYHPCQVLSDLMTVKEKRGSFDHMKVAWIGDGNNVAHSWINAARVLGFELVLACPQKYFPKEAVLEGSGENIRVLYNPEEAAKDADVINTDVWASMGQEDQKAQRLSDFEGFQVDESLVRLAKPEVLIMHCLPAHRGEEISAKVLDGPNSIVFDQAENKLHLQQALLEKMLLK
jgi:ornithine carbamoyltransferase